MTMQTQNHHGLLLWVSLVLVLGIGRIADAAAPTNVVGGTARGAVAYVPGKYGLAASLTGRNEGGKTFYGIDYPCNAQTFNAREGTFACWVKAPAYNCRTLFSAGELHAFHIWHNKQKDEAGNERYVYFPYATMCSAKGWHLSYMEPDIWYHVAVTWESTNPQARSQVRMYVNGQGTARALKGEPPFDAAILPTLSIGLFEVTLDEVVLLDRALSDEEVKRLFFLGAFRPDEHTRLYMSFDDRTVNGVCAMQP